MSNFKQLTKQIIEASNNKYAKWDEIIKEWKLVHIQKVEDYNYCLCGKEIKELCHIQNIHNLTEFIIGNECIKKICPNDEVNSKTHTLFDCVKKLKTDITKAPNKTLIRYCKNKDILTDWEYEFSLNTFKKRELSDKQNYCRQQINKKILSNLKM